MHRALHRFDRSPLQLKWEHPQNPRPSPILLRGCSGIGSAPRAGARGACPRSPSRPSTPVRFVMSRRSRRACRSAWSMCRASILPSLATATRDASHAKEGQKRSSWISGSLGLGLILRSAGRSLPSGAWPRAPSGRERATARRSIESGNHRRGTIDGREARRAAITEGLAAYLCAAIGRGPGALTPTEAGLGAEGPRDGRSRPGPPRHALWSSTVTVPRFAVAGPSSESLEPEARDVFTRPFQYAEAAEGERRLQETPRGSPDRGKPWLRGRLLPLVHDINHL